MTESGAQAASKRVGSWLLSHVRPVSLTEWREQQARFEALARHVDGMWTRVPRGAPRWTFMPDPKKGVTTRDVLQFEAEAMIAGRMLIRSPSYRWVFTSLRRETHIDRWMNTALSLIGEEPRIRVGGNEDGLSVEGELVMRVPHLSAVACARLAAGEKPKNYRNLRN